MISDVLSDAVSQIRQLQSERPESFSDCAAEIDKVTAIMESLRLFFDSDTPTPKAEGRLGGASI
jgi:hypothetical protein